MKPLSVSLSVGTSVSLSRTWKCNYPLTQWPFQLAAFGPLMQKNVDIKIKMFKKLLKT